MYKIATLCAIAIGIPHYLLAQNAKVNCYEGDDLKGTLFEDREIKLDKKGKPRTYNQAYLDRKCSLKFPSGEEEKKVLAKFE